MALVLRSSDGAFGPCSGVAIDRARKSQALSEGRPLVVLAEDAAALEDRHDLLDEEGRLVFRLQFMCVYGE